MSSPAQSSRDLEYHCDSANKSEVGEMRNQHSAVRYEDQAPGPLLNQSKSELVEKPITETTNEQRPPQRIYPSGAKRTIIIAALCLGTLLVAIDINIIAVAIPTISTAFHALDDVGWYGSAYIICLMVLQPVFGVIYKFFEPKTIYLCSILIFELGSVILATAPSSPVFVLGRAITGCGGAGLLQGALYIVALSVPLEKRPLYLGIVVSSFGAAAGFGPIMGGALTDRLSWRWCFWINVPVGAVAALIVFIFLKLEDTDNTDRKLSVKKKLRHLDPFGVCLLLGSVCCIVLALQWGGSTFPWRSAKIIGLLIGSGLLGVLFFIFEWRLGETAMLPLRVFGQRSIMLGCLYECFLQMINDSTSYYMPFYFQATQGASPVLSGAEFLPLVLVEIFTIGITGAIVSKTGHYVPFMVAGGCIATVGIGLLTQIALDTPASQWATYLAISGLGIGLGLNLPFTALHVVLSEDDVPIGNGITVLSGQLGGAIAVSVSQATFLNRLYRELPKLVPSISTHDVIAAGATKLRSLAPDDDHILRLLRTAYAQAVANTLWLPVASASAAAICACGMEWKKITSKEGKEKVEDHSEVGCVPKASS